jgi:Flp pilus assembly protein TadD
MLEAAAEQHPEDPVAARRLASVYEAKGDWAKARSVSERLLSANPKSVPTLVRLAQLQSERFGDQAKAMELARKARELDPDSPQIAHTLGRLAYQAGDHKWALSLLQETNRKQPNDATVLYDLAFSFYSLGRVAEAISSMQDAVQRGLDPARSTEAKKFIALCSLFDNALEAERAAPQIQETLDNSPEYAPALMAAAALYARKGSANAARQACEKVLVRYPLFAPAHKLLARLHSGPDGDLGKAYEHGTKAREALPGDADVAKTLGIVSFRRGDFARAVELLKESARKMAQDAELLYYLGMAHLQLKQRIEARQALNQALKLSLDASLAESARKALAELK